MVTCTIDKYTTMKQKQHPPWNEMFGVAPGDRSPYTLKIILLGNLFKMMRELFLNGNRLMFIEPLEATSTEQYVRWTLLVCEWIFDGR